jgi:hypothetical protein
MTEIAQIARFLHNGLNYPIVFRPKLSVSRIFQRDLTTRTALVLKEGT